MSIYQNIYNLIQTHIFGSVASAYTELFTIFLSLCAVAFVVMLPFTIVLLVIKLIRG